MSETRPCRYPGCRDIDGNPRMTSDGMCVTPLKNGRITGCQHLFLRDWRRLALDWVQLHTQLPTPSPNPRASRAPSREYGHPAEWASVMCDDIAAIFNETHDELAEILGDRPPRSVTSERARIQAAWTYIEPRIDKLAHQEWAGDTAEIVRDTHNKIRATLGHNRPVLALPLPCPNTDCGLKTLQRVIAVGQDFITCGACGYTIKDTYYPLLVRITLDTIISGAA